MQQWTGEERDFAVKAYYQNGETLVRARSTFRTHFNVPRNWPVPSNRAIHQKWQYGTLCQHRESSGPNFLRMRLAMQLMRTAMWKCCKIYSPHNSTVFLWMKTRYSSRMEQQATQQECQWTQLMLCSRTESFPGIGITHGPTPRTHDLTPCDYFLWGTWKQMFETRPRTIGI